MFDQFVQYLSWFVRVLGRRDWPSPGRVNAKKRRNDWLDGSHPHSSLLFIVADSQRRAKKHHHTETRPMVKKKRSLRRWRRWRRLRRHLTVLILTPYIFQFFIEGGTFRNSTQATQQKNSQKKGTTFNLRTTTFHFIGQKYYGRLRIASNRRLTTCYSSFQLQWFSQWFTVAISCVRVWSSIDFDFDDHCWFWLMTMTDELLFFIYYYIYTYIYIRIQFFRPFLLLLPSLFVRFTKLYIIFSEGRFFVVHWMELVQLPSLNKSHT